jgi:hypothetical protein
MISLALHFCRHVEILDRQYLINVEMHEISVPWCQSLNLAILAASPFKAVFKRSPTAPKVSRAIGVNLRFIALVAASYLLDFLCSARLAKYKGWSIGCVIGWLEGEG